MNIRIDNAGEFTPKLIANYQCRIGENPLWNPIDNRLYWCDIPAGRIFRYAPVTGLRECCFQGGVIGGFTIENDGALLLFMANGAVRRWLNGTLTTIIPEILEERESRFNDAIADPMGRVYCGTTSTPSRAGRLYRLDRDRSFTAMVEGILCSNGMAFSPDHRKMYYADSCVREIYEFDFDGDTGSLRNKHLFVKTSEADGLPDGMTVDAEGCLWLAQWDGGCVVRYRPDAREACRISIPAKKVSSLTFGGPDYSDLYVTTAGGDCPTENGEMAGALFRLNVGVRGVAEFRSRIGTP